MKCDCKFEDLGGKEAGQKLAEVIIFPGLLKVGRSRQLTISHEWLS
jgi:hypothetical protein